MVPVVSFRGEMQNVGWIGFVPSDPIGNILAETAADLRIEPDNIVFPKMPKP